MTTETLVAVFTILLTIALAAERFIEIFKPIIEKISVLWQPSVKITLAILVGFGLAALFRFDLLKDLGLGVAPVIGYALAGLVASTGSSVIHPILEWLKTLKNNTTTEKIVERGDTVTTETVKSDTVPEA
jgi:hypothetical protein